MEAMETMILIAIGFMLFVVLLWRLGAGRSKTKPASDSDATPLVPRDSGNVASSSSGTRRMRRRVAAAPEEEEEVPGEALYYSATASKKKEQKKQEKEARRQAESAATEIRKEKQDRQAEMRRRRDEEHEAEERRKEEELKIQQEKQAAAEAEQFEKWKDSFTVDVAGTAGEDTEEGESLIRKFVDYIKKHKCVALEDLAAEFHMRTQDCISRISSLETMGELSGIMDDRGKYIYISAEEMKAVADYVIREGRVSISHLARMSNQFIDLESKEDGIEAY